MTIVTTKLAHYQAAPFVTEVHDLCFVIEAEQTVVKHRQTIKRVQKQKDEQGWTQTLEQHAVLNGEDLDIIRLELNGEALPASAYRYENQLLTLFDVPEQFELYSEVRLQPEKNTELSGLYRSNGIYCTQCEAEGFRRISFAFDRPDVLSTFRVRIESEKRLVQLSNGNLEAQGDLGHDRHFSEWYDPHPKPTYLFALVTGELECLSQRYTSSRKDKIDLRIYAAAPYIEQTDWAMKSLIESMAWDEKRFNLHYDLKRFNIVSISDFNMGAMENKSLNIFNDACVLADTETATDEDFHRIRAIIGHEYFHNWTGNRVTCRDWFQLSLKEGLTVFRDQEFSADLGERALERIRDVQLLRASQFLEDKSPMRHPVQPQEYAAIDNFYTATVYEKGAEIIRMYHSILGEKRFQEGMRLYFERHDGQAVRIEDFAAAMTAAAEGEFDFTGDFFKWYTTAGTPKVTFSTSYNAHERCFIFSAAQDINAVSPPRALVIPIRFSLLQRNGRLYAFENKQHTQLLLLNESRKTWKFKSDDPHLIPILMQNFSAPIYYDYDYDNEALALIVNHAEDGFARFEAMQSAYRRLFEKALHQPNQLKESSRDVVDLMEQVLQHPKYSAAEKALLLSLPSLETLMNFLPAPLDMDAITLMYARVKQILALRLRRLFLDTLPQLPRPSAPQYSTKDAGLRHLQGVIMQYLAVFEDEIIRDLLLKHYQDADCMTVRMNSLNALNERHDAQRESALADFYQRFQHLPLVIDKWFALQARADQADALPRIEALAEHEAFQISNPNRFRALVGQFARFNPRLFHAQDGSGYRFVTRQIERIIRLNPQIAARVLNVFAIVAQLDAGRKNLVREELKRLQALDGLSVDVLETLERLQHGL